MQPLTPDPLPVGEGGIFWHPISDRFDLAYHETRMDSEPVRFRVSLLVVLA